MKSRIPLLCFWFLLFLKINDVLSICDLNSAVEYTPIPPDNYDRNYSAITSNGKHPLGFSKAVWYYDDPDASNPCFKVTGAANKWLEIMFETFPTSRLCVKFQGEQICSDGGAGRLYSCVQAKSDPLVLEFLCDSQCGEYSVRFWYRFVLDNLTDNDPEDKWCDNRNQDEYPENLISLPADFPMTTEVTTPADGAVGFSLSPYRILAFACIILSLKFLK